MPIAMDREACENGSWEVRTRRSMHIATAVVAGIHRVSQLSAAMELVTDESKVDLKNELAKELSFLTANTAQLKRELASGGRLEGAISLRETELIQNAEKVIAAASHAHGY